MTLARDLYASKIQSDCVPIPAGASSALKIATLGFFHPQNSDSGSFFITNKGFLCDLGTGGEGRWCSEAWGSSRQGVCVDIFPPPGEERRRGDAEVLRRLLTPRGRRIPLNCFLMHFGYKRFR